MMNGSLDNSSVQKLQIAYTVASATGVLVSSILLLGVLLVKAFQTVLQRLFITIVVITLVHDALRIASIHHNPEDHEIRDKACVILAMCLEWLHWCLYLFLTAGVLYLLIIVYIQSGDNSVVVATIRKSMRLKISLEVGAITGILLAPWAIIWVPYVLNQYGFDEIICAIIPSNEYNKTATDVAVKLFYNYAPREILAFSSGISALGMTLVYCKLSAEMKHARSMIKKLAISMLVLFIYFLLLHLQIIGRNGGNTSRIFFVFWHLIAKFLVLLGYLVLFHCSNMHDQIRKLSRRKKEDKVLVPEEDREKKKIVEYGTFQESSRMTLPSSTRSITLPFTGGFTTISKV